MPTRQQPQSNRHRRRKGISLIYFAIALPLVAAICSLGVDWARVQLVKTELQGAADAAARAAAAELPNTTDASTAAVNNAAQNQADGTPVTITPATDLAYGTWDDATATFTAGGWSPNAVRVTIRRSIPMAFATLVGFNSASTTVTATAKVLPYGYGVIGLNYIKMSGNTTMSYRSTGGGPSQYGSIASNGNITLAGSSYVNGDARPGQYGGTVTGAAGRVRGSTAPLGEVLSYPSVPASYFASHNDNSQLPAGTLTNQGHLKLTNGQNVTLPGGTYYINDLSLASGATLAFTGQSTLIVYGNVSLSGQASTYSDLPKNLVIAQAADPNNGRIGSFSVGGSSALNAFLYAPQSSVVMSGSGDFYGSMIAGSIDMTGSSGIHYDLAISGGGAISLVK